MIPNMDNIEIVEADGWVQLTAGNKGFNLLDVNGIVNYYTSSVDVAPTTEKGDVANGHSPRLWDVGTFAWVKTVSNASIVVYT